MVDVSRPSTLETVADGYWVVEEKIKTEEVISKPVNASFMVLLQFPF